MQGWFSCICQPAVSVPLHWSDAGRALYVGQSFRHSTVDIRKDGGPRNREEPGLTRDRVVELRLWDVFRHDDRETGLEMRVNVAVQEPRARVISLRIIPKH